MWQSDLRTILSPWLPDDCAKFAIWCASFASESDQVYKLSSITSAILAAEMVMHESTGANIHSAWDAINSLQYHRTGSSHTAYACSSAAQAATAAICCGYQTPDEYAITTHVVDAVNCAAYACGLSVIEMLNLYLAEQLLSAVNG